MNVKVIQLTFVNTTGYTQSLLVRKGEKSYLIGLLLLYFLMFGWSLFLFFPLSMVFFQMFFKKKDTYPSLFQTNHDISIHYNIANV